MIINDILLLQTDRVILHRFYSILFVFLSLSDREDAGAHEKKIGGTRRRIRLAGNKYLPVSRARL